MEATSTDAQIDRLLADHPARVGRLLLRLRDLIRSLIPDVEERIYLGWRGVGFHDPVAGYICALFPREADVRIGFERGHLLHDPQHRLEGDGSRVRYLAIGQWSDDLPDVVAGFVDEARHLS